MSYMRKLATGVSLVALGALVFCGVYYLVSYFGFVESFNVMADSTNSSIESTADIMTSNLPRFFWPVLVLFAVTAQLILFLIGMGIVGAIFFLIPIIGLLLMFLGLKSILGMDID